MNSERTDTSELESTSLSLNSLKTEISGIWTGNASNSYSSQYDNVLNLLKEVINQIELFNTALDKLEIYKANKLKIEELENQIVIEKTNPSKKTKETVKTLGVSHSRTVYIIDQDKINDLQIEINKLLEMNQTLRNEINAIISSITGVTQGDINDLGSIIVTDIDGNDITEKLNQSISAINNLLPKNNTDISHRGYTPGGIIDNSKEGFVLAGEKGFWGCEADIRFDNNGNLVCSHNAVKDGQQITSFNEYLDICKQYGMTAIIDLKYEKGVGPADPYLSPAVIQAINNKGMINSCIIQTNNKTDIPYIRQTSQDARIWYLTDVINDQNIQIINDYNIECVNIKAGENDAWKIQKLAQNGTDVCVWNVFSEDSKNKRLQYGAKYVMSDNVLGITPYQNGEKDYNGIVN